MASILVVEDDPTVGEVVVGYLRRNGHTAAAIGDGLQAEKEIRRNPPDLAVLDVMLPGLDGLALCAKLRADYPELPIIMLTALAEADDRIAGLEVGADDYVTKPFSPRELVLRIDSVLRRAQPAITPASEGDMSITSADLVLDAAARRLTRAGTEVSLTVREMDLLVFLMRNPGRAFSREELMHDVWGWTFGDHSTVTVHVRRLREKVEADPVHPTLIQTVWGVGYRLELQPELQP